ncbi:hypothetical protein [Bacilliculturomica massiliensis]|nr:hypothetical protein [Bacilliculturomica massiliensis]
MIGVWWRRTSAVKIFPDFVEGDRELAAPPADAASGRLYQDYCITADASR